MRVDLSLAEQLACGCFEWRLNLGHLFPSFGSPQAGGADGMDVDGAEETAGEGPRGKAARVRRSGAGMEAGKGYVFSRSWLLNSCLEAGTATQRPARCSRLAAALHSCLVLIFSAHLLLSSRPRTRRPTPRLRAPTMTRSRV